MIKSILLVGGSGYLGKELGALMESQSLDVFYTGTKIKEESNHIRIDFTIENTYENLRGYKFDLIIFLAAKINALATNNLNHGDLVLNTVDYARFLQFVNVNSLTEKIIYVSSMTVYSKDNQCPVVENGKIGPYHTYGLSKALAEQITEFYCATNKISGLILRIPGIYGGKRKSGFIFSTLTKLYSNEVIEINTNGLGYWETIHVSDLSNLIISLIDKYNWPSSCEVVNISYGEETDIYETAKMIKEMVKSKSKIILFEPIDYVRFYLSNHKLKQFVDVPYSYKETLRMYLNSLTI